MDFQTFLSTYGAIVGLVGVIGAVAYAIGSVVNGMSRADKDLIRTLQTHVSQLQVKDESQQREIDESQQELKRLNRQKEIDDSKLQQLTLVLQNRSPELETTLNQLRVAMGAVVKHMIDHGEIDKHIMADPEIVQELNTEIEQAEEADYKTDENLEGGDSNNQ